MDKRKDIILKLIFVLVGIMLVLTFFSNTIHNLNVTGVVVTDNISGDITTVHRGSSVLSYPEEFYTQWAEETGQLSLFVRDEDKVREGDPLFSIHFEIDRGQIVDRIVYLRQRNSQLPRTYRAENMAEVERLERFLAYAAEESEESEEAAETEDAGSEENAEDRISRVEGIKIPIVHTQYALVSGIVNLSTGIEDRAPVIEGQPILQLAVRQGHHFEFSVYLPSSFIPSPRGIVSRKIDIRVPAVGRRELSGEIMEITAVDNQFRVDFTVIVSDAIGGERVNVTIEDVYTTRADHLPNYAVRKDQVGDFILIARQVPNTMLGYTYIAERVDIEVTMSNDLITVFNLHKELDAPIILEADRPIEAGDRVRLVGQGQR